ncbi:MAG: hypothetical protein J5779_02255 [Clostridia bacterium]|nr:hypothetical protein [Clostridia bacterium]
MKKKLLSLLVAIVMALTPVFFAGCELEDDLKDSASSAGQEAAKSFAAEFFDGFKVVYSTSMITGQTGEKQILDDQFYDDNLLRLLNAYYGSGSENTDPNNTFFPDSIRQLIIKDNVTGNAVLDVNGKAWKWNLGDGELSKATVQTLIASSENYDSFCSAFIEYAEAYPQLSTYYATPIQIVLFETMLGYKKLTTFEAIFSDGNTIISVKDCPNNTSLNGKDVNSEDVQNYLGYFNEIDKTNCGLKLKYYSTATYSGLTKADADSFIDYILNEVIGADVVAYDYTTFGPGQTTYREIFDGENSNYVEDGYNYYNYRNYVGRVAEMVYSQVYDENSTFEYTYTTTAGDEIKYVFEKEEYASANPEANIGGFSPKSASFLSDYETEAFFESENALKMFDDSDTGSATSFENSPLAEYQSVTIMLNKQQDFGGLWMQIFSPNPDIAINLYVRCYLYDENTKTGVLCQWSADDLNFYQEEPILEPLKEVTNDEQEYVEGKGYLLKTTDKDNSGNPIAGYYTDFEINVNLNEIPEKYQIKGEDKEVDELQIDAVLMDAFNNFEEENGVRMKAVGNAVGEGRVEANLDGENYAYKVIESKNGFGGVTVIDETKALSSFFEVVFDIKKDPTLPNQNYDYKLYVLTQI